MKCLFIGSCAEKKENSYLLVCALKGQTIKLVMTKTEQFRKMMDELFYIKHHIC